MREEGTGGQENINIVVVVSREIVGTPAWIKIGLYVCKCLPESGGDRQMINQWRKQTQAIMSF